MQLAFSGLSPLFEAGAMFVASSPLLVSAASQQFANQRLAQGVHVWQRPSFLTLDGWLMQLWQEARFSRDDVPSLLSPQQEHLLWKQAIDESAPHLFDSDAAARLARRANAILAQWHIPVDHEAWQEHVDGEQFLRWRKAVRARCRERGWMLRADLWRVAADWPLPQHVVFFGFKIVPPALAALQSRISRSQVFGAAEQPVEPGAVHAYESFEEELEAAARWARLRFEASSRSEIAVFVPDLATHRGQVERAFLDVFYPRSSARLEKPAAYESVFHIHAAPPLSSHPLVAAALLLLELGKGLVDQASATSLLRSPFLRGADKERDVRAEADLKLRRRREPEVGLYDIRRSAEHCPVLSRSLERVHELFLAQPKTTDLPAWSRFFADVLQAAGWPGDLEWTPEEYDVIESWKEIVSELGALGLVRRSVTYGVALHDLQQLLAAAAGIDRGDVFSPVQIVDAQDSEGLRWDSAISVGLSEDMWPPVVRSSPLIPPRLQRQFGVPGSSPQLTQQEYHRQTRALFASSPDMVGTYSGHLAPVVRPYVNVAAGRIHGWDGALALHAFERVPCEVTVDTNATPFRVDGAVRGGTGLLKNQSLCPFRAVAENRLGARAPEEACFGFDALDRGNFVHKALQAVWEELKSSARLRLTPEDDLRRIVRRSVEAAVARRSDDDFSAQTQQAERERLEDLIYDWLTQVEKDRQVDFTVENVETELQFSLAGLPLRLRIDRIDRLRDGRLVLIDYKSGKQSKGKLECPRPQEPQLLVYAAAQNAEVDAVFFGQLKPRDLGLKGMSRTRHAAGNSTKVWNDKWDSFLSEARAAVHQLAQDFLAGKAAIDPIAATVCQYCGAKPLCRVNEGRSQDEEDCEW